MIKLLLYVHEPTIATIYLERFRLVDVEFELVHCFKAFYGRGVADCYSGVLLDIVSSIRAPSFDREVIKDLLEVYPALRLRWDPASGEIRTLMIGAGSGQRITLPFFIRNYCQQFIPRGLRFGSRKQIYCNVLWSVAETPMPETFERSVTFDLSMGGCFLFTVQPLAKKTAIWLQLVEMKEVEPIRGTVEWCREWGKTMQVPGVGVRFQSLLAEHRKELSLLMEGEAIAVEPAIE